MFNVFKRINTEGKPLVGQEIRHALNPGPARELLRELAESAEFLRATGGTVNPRRMADRECVLRFLAFRSLGDDSYGGKLDEFLMNAMKHLNGAPGSHSSLRDDFRRAMSLAWDLFGKEAFRKPNRPGYKRWRSPVNKPLFESLSVALAEVTESGAEWLRDRKGAVAAELGSLMESAEFSREHLRGNADYETGEDPLREDAGTGARELVVIESLHLGNFKCFRDQRVPLGGLTVLAGLNGAGKSTVIQAVLTVHQFWKDEQEGAGPWRGPLVNLGSFHDVLHEGSDDDVVRIDVSLSDGATAHWEVHPPRSGGETGGSARPSTEAYPRDLFYLSADRLGPRATLPFWGERAPVTPLGKRGEHVLWYLSSKGSVPVRPAVRHPDEPTNTLANQTNAWLNVVSPGAVLRVRQIPEADCAVASYRYERPEDVPSRPFRATNVGFGVSYALPPIVALLAPERDGTDPREHLIIIENPEAHIHPAGQTSMAELAARAVAGGSQVILETHSDHVLNGVRLAVAEGILNADKVMIHYFERTGLDVRMTTPVLTDTGRMDVWPEGFFDQHERSLSRLISIPQAPVQEG